MSKAGFQGVDAGHLRAFVERIERLEEEKKALADDIKDVYGEAKGSGFDVKTIRKIVALRKQDADKRREAQEILDLYLHALGMLADTPLGAAALQHATAPADKQARKRRRAQREPAAPGSEADEDDARAPPARPGAPTPARYQDAVALVRRERNAGPSYLQRRLGIAFDEAVTILERMEHEGLVTAARNGQPRKVIAPFLPGPGEGAEALGEGAEALGAATP